LFTCNLFPHSVLLSILALSKTQTCPASNPVVALILGQRLSLSWSYRLGLTIPPPAFLVLPNSHQHPVTPPPATHRLARESKTEGTIRNFSHGLQMATKISRTQEQALGSTKPHVKVFSP
jgi:hypothetical protein